MSYHRKHLESFIAAANISGDQAAQIKERAEIAITQFGEVEDGEFSGGNLSEVLGSSDLVDKFNNMWEGGQIR